MSKTLLIHNQTHVMRSLIQNHSFPRLVKSQHCEQLQNILLRIASLKMDSSAAQIYTRSNSDYIRNSDLASQAFSLEITNSDDPYADIMMQPNIDTNGTQNIQSGRIVQLQKKLRRSLKQLRYQINQAIYLDEKTDRILRRLDYLDESCLEL